MRKVLIVAGIGCLSVVLLVVLAVGGTFAWAAFQARQLGSPAPQRVERSIEAVRPAPTGAAAALDAAGPAATDGMRLEVDLREGEFTIGAGPAGSDIRVEGEYADGYYELIEESIPAGAPGGPRTSIRFGSSASFLVRMVGGLLSGGGGNQPRLTVLIPEDLPVDLVLRAGLGEARVDLGGLTLTGLRTELSMGNHVLDFSRPVARDVPEVDLDFSMGNVTIENLANARASRIEASARMGAVVAELGGEWRPGSVTELSFDQSMGEVRFRVPATVRLEAETTRSGPGSSGAGASTETEGPEDADAPVLKLRVSTSMGDSSISRF